jgi:hypothetical protein
VTNLLSYLRLYKHRKDVVENVLTEGAVGVSVSAIELKGNFTGSKGEWLAVLL